MSVPPTCSGRRTSISSGRELPPRPADGEELCEATGRWIFIHLFIYHLILDFKNFCLGKEREGEVRRLCEGQAPHTVFYSVIIQLLQFIIQ